jgi:hypothetical protein
MAEPEMREPRPSPIVMIKLLLRLRPHAGIGVRAARIKTDAQKEEGRLQSLTLTLNQQTTYRTRSSHLDNHIGVNLRVFSSFREFPYNATR